MAFKSNPSDLICSLFCKTMYRHWNYYLFLPSQIQTYLSLITTTHTLTVKCCFNPCLHVQGYFVAQSFFCVFWPSTHKGHLSSLMKVFVLCVPLSPFLTSDCAQWYSFMLLIKEHFYMVRVLSPPVALNSVWHHFLHFHVDGSIFQDSGCLTKYQKSPFYKRNQ